MFIMRFCHVMPFFKLGIKEYMLIALNIIQVNRMGDIRPVVWDRVVTYQIRKARP